MGEDGTRVETGRQVGEEMADTRLEREAGTGSNCRWENAGMMFTESCLLIRVRLTKKVLKKGRYKSNCVMLCHAERLARSTQLRY